MTRHTGNLLETQAKDTLRKLLASTVVVDLNELEKLINLFELVSFKKNHIIIDEGEIAEHFYFIYKGIIRVYFFKNERLVIERFEKESALFGGNFTHLTKEPGTHVYESVEDVVLLKIKYTDLEELCRKSHDVEHVYRVSMELFHTNFVKRLISFKSLNTEERYHEFIEQYGDVVNRVSLKDIANYLDMTPETLSRIRAKYDGSKQMKK